MGKRASFKAVGMTAHRGMFASCVLLPGCSFKNHVSLTAKGFKNECLNFSETTVDLNLYIRQIVQNYREKEIYLLWA